LAVGVIVKVTVIGAAVVLVSVPLISPEPLAAIPVTVPVLFLVHAKAVPAVVLVFTMVVMAAPEQIVCEAGVATATGVGLTNMVAVMGRPGQPLAVGVMVKVTVMGADVVFVRAPLMSPVPLAAMPVTVALLFLVHAKVVPVVALVFAMVVIVEPEQIVCDAGVATATGVGFTSTVAVIGAPGQLFIDGVMVKVTVMGAAVVFVNAPLMSPEPLAAIPVTVTVLFLVQANVAPIVVLEFTIVVIVAPEQIV